MDVNPPRGDVEFLVVIGPDDSQPGCRHAGCLLPAVQFHFDFGEVSIPLDLDFTRFEVL